MIYFVSVAAILVIFLLIGCSIESFLNKTPASLALGKFQIITIFSIVFCYLLYVMKNAILARLFLGLYCFSLDILLYAFYKYICSYETQKSEIYSSKILLYWSYIIVAIDGVILLATSVTGLCFDVAPYTLNAGIESWLVAFKPAICFHLVICYSFSAYILGMLIKAIVQTAPVYKHRFILILFLFILAFSVNLIFISTPEIWIYDYSSLVFGVLVAVCFSINMHSVPKIIRRRIVGIASESVSDAVMCFDYKGKCIYTNNTALKFYTADNDEWVHNFLSSDNDLIIRTITIPVEGEKHTCKVEYRRFYDNKKRLVGSYIKLNDYTEEVKKIQQEEYRASHDPLTGLLNREFFFRETQKVLSSEPGVPRYLVCTDIKNFKMFNDLFGTSYGDTILLKQAEMLKKALYDSVVLGRISGDRFAMLIRQRDFKPNLALENSKKLRDITKDVNLPVTVFIGVYEITDSSENVRSMYDKAYLAIKNIRDKNDTCVAFYDSSYMEKLIAEKNIVSRFGSALENKKFTIYLQSQINPKTNECVGAEALARWDYPEKGIIPPADFVSILEKSGQIYKLDKYIWEEAVKLLKDWQSRGIKKYISVNISPKDFYYIDIYKTFRNLVEQYEISPEYLNLEITESVISGENADHKETLLKLQKYGFRIEMDDFGSGYSSLNLLKNISMDVLKIDMGFLEKTENPDRAFLIINTIAKMAKKLGMITIAEGVEYESQIESLVKANVDLFQGYLYSKPLTVSDFEKKYLEVQK